MAKYSIVYKSYRDAATDGFGITKDNWLEEANPDKNWGQLITMFCVRQSGDVGHMIFEIEMPSEEDILGFSELEQVRIMLEVVGTSPTDRTLLLGIICIGDEVWDEGLSYEPGYSNWDDAQNGVAWLKGNGAIVSRGTTQEEGEVVLDVDWLTNTTSTLVFDVTGAISMGEKKTFVVFPLKWPEGDVNGSVCSIQNSTYTNRPAVRLKYRDNKPEAFVEAEDRLRIEPWEDNPELPKFTWGANSDEDFQYWLMNTSLGAIPPTQNRWTSDDPSIEEWVDDLLEPILDVNQGSKYFYIPWIYDQPNRLQVSQQYRIIGGPNAGTYTVTAVSFQYITAWSIFGYRITVSESIPSATAGGEWELTKTVDDDETYLYQLWAGDQHGATASAMVSFYKPSVVTAALSPNGTINVGQEVTLTVTSKREIKRVYVDWKDGIDSWYEFDTAELTQTLTHLYTYWSNGAAITPDIRVESADGFWSKLTPADNSLTINDVQPDVKLVVRKTNPSSGESIRLNASLTSPIASNVLISDYEYYVNGSWQRPVAVGSITLATDMGGSPNMVQMTDVWHGLKDGDTIRIYGGGSGYYTGIWKVYNVTTNTFEIISSFNGTETMSWHIISPVFDVVPSSSPQDVKARIDTTSGFNDIESNEVTVTIITETAEPINPDPITGQAGLLSPNTKISQRTERTSALTRVDPEAGGSGEQEIRWGQTNTELTLDGMSAKKDLHADLEVLRILINNDILSVVSVLDEDCGQVIKYIGKVRSLRITKTALRYATWSIVFRVFERDPPVPSSLP